MNSYKKVIKKAKEVKIVTDRTLDLEEMKRTEIECFSYKLRRAMGLSKKDVPYVVEAEIEWKIPGYIIYGEIHVWNMWKPILEVLPDTGGVFERHRWRGIPDNWHFKKAGTRTEILPPKHEQEKILQLIRDNA